MRAIRSSWTLAFVVACGGAAGSGTDNPTPAGATTPGSETPNNSTTPPPVETAAPVQPGPPPTPPVVVPKDPFDGVPAPPADSACHPLSLAGHCQFPYPSNWFSVRDATSPTGQKLHLPQKLLKEAITKEIAPGLRPDVILNGQEGFSPSAPILFELDGAVDTASLPLDGGTKVANLGDAVVAVFDMATGARIPVRAEVSPYASSSSVAAKKNVVQVFPRGRFEYGHHYVAALTTKLQRADKGGPFPPPKMWWPASTEPAWVYHDALLTYVEGQGLPRDHVVSITDFSTRTEANATARMYRLMRLAYAEEHPVRNVHVNASIFPGINAQVDGEIRLSNFRTSDGDIDDGALSGNENWVPFILTIPDSAAKTPAPVAIYGHALITDRNLISLVASTNAAKGFATIAIDHPNHGARSGPDGGHIATLMAPEHIGRLVGLLAQSPIDQVSVLKALRTSLKAYDAAPRTLFKTGDGVPDLDTTKVIYQGTSLGGVLGSAFVGGACALGLDLKGAYLQVSGSGMVNTLAHSSLWTGLYSRIIPSAADGAESLWALAVVGHRMDLGDALTVAHKIDRPLLVTYGIDDEVVSNYSTLALAELAKTSVLNAVLRGADVEHLPYVGIAAVKNAPAKDGSGLLQLKIQRTGAVPLDLETHLTFLDGNATEALQLWLPTL